MSEAEKIAELLFPPIWVEVEKDFKVDNNAGKRGCAVVIATQFLEVLKSEDTARCVMKAFYRREHGREPFEGDVMALTAHMGTALLAYELRLKGDFDDE